MRKYILPFAFATLCFSHVAQAAVLTINVQNIKTDEGHIGCGLYGSADGFPMDGTKATTQWHQASTQGVTCQFKDLPPGTYAVAISHDLNGNQQTDTNFLGIPTEDWGVTNNARPVMRAPTFDEAKFDVKQDTTVEVRID